ncbi:MAG: S-layer homology domain-containing protein [Cyanobacteria bacterium SID2]|nr:S-layer homology domain-containing protein [Cyanobacteria bacterium SID2]MBP0005437.1 S-layer homology domain-containing protein [Cyanobacteria bacterium SBC]
MVNSNPPEPPSSRPVTRDEWIAIFVALSTLGGVGAWVVTRSDFPWSIGTTPASLTRPVDGQRAADGQLGRTVDRGRATTETESDESEIDREEPTSASSLSPEESQLSEPTGSDGEGADGDRSANSSNAAVNPVVVPPIFPNATTSPVPEATPPDETVTSSTPLPEATPPDEASSPTAEATTPPDETTAASSPSPIPEATSDATPPAQVDPNLAPPGAPVGFIDVPEDYWAKPYIDAMSSRQLIKGVEENRFAPEQSLTRAEFATLIGTVFEGNVPQSDEIAFSDLQSDYWGIEAVNESVRLGFLKGYPGEIFQPDRPVTRLEVLLSLNAGLELEAPENPDAVLAPYIDRDTVPQWAKAPIAAAIDAGLLTTDSDTTQLNLQQEATRADVTSMMYRALVRAGRAEPIEP